jgi:hypothetical protein
VAPPLLTLADRLRALVDAKGIGVFALQSSFPFVFPLLLVLLHDIGLSARNASARLLVCSATKKSAVREATCSALAAYLRNCLTIFITDQFRPLCVVPW